MKKQTKIETLTEGEKTRSVDEAWNNLATELIRDAILNVKGKESRYTKLEVPDEIYRLGYKAVRAFHKLNALLDLNWLMTEGIKLMVLMGVDEPWKLMKTLLTEEERPLVLDLPPRPGTGRAGYHAYYDD